VKIVTFPHIWQVFKQMQECDRGDCSAREELHRSITKHLTSVVNGSLLFLEPIVRASISWITLLRKRRRYFDAVTQHWLLSGLSVAGLSIFIHLRDCDKTCFGFSTQNYVRFWYYCEIRYRRGIENLPCRAQPTT
jgi:hypothetical protein